MSGFFKKRWIWVVALFLVINIVGLLRIIYILENKGVYVANRPMFSIMSSISGNLRQIFWPMKKVVEAITESEFRVGDIKPTVSGTETGIEIELNKDVDLSKIKGFIEITPKVDFVVEERYNGIGLSGDFKPGVSYDVEVLKGMPSAKELKLNQSTKKTVVMSDYDPTFKFKVQGMYVSLKGNQNIPVEATNIDVIKVKIHRVYDNNVVYLLNNSMSYSIPDDIGLDVIEKTINTNVERNKPTEILLNLKELIKGDSRGIFFMRLTEPDSGYSWSGDSKLILTSDIGMVVKKSDNGLFVWLNSLSNNGAIAGATIKVFSKTNQQLLEGTSDTNGLVQFKGVDWSGDRKPFVVTASKDGDQSFIELEKCTLTETDFKTEGRPYISSGYEGFLYTDRGVYRPGEKVYLRAILRGPNLEKPDSFPVVFEITRPDGRQFAKLNGVLSRFGTVDLDIDIPDYALTGGYTANLMLPGSKEVTGSVKFSVEEFMPDRLKVTVTLPEERLQADKTSPITVKAEQFFGAPAEGRNVEVLYDLKPQEFKPDGYKDYSFVDSSKSFTFKTTSLDEKTSDNNGSATFELKLPEKLSPPSALRCEISAVVKEVGGRAVTSHIERMFDAYPYYIGIRQAVAGYATPGREIKFDYVVLSPDGKKIDAAGLEVNIYKVVWNNVLKKDDKGEYRYVSESREEVVRTDILKEGNLSYSYTPKSWGDYVIRIKGKDVSSHSTSLTFYCSDSGYMPWAMQRPDRIELKLDKSSYAVGETAKLTIKSPFKGKALITVSKDKIITAKVIELANPTQEVPLTVEDGWQPNAYCAVTVIRPVDPGEDWVAYRAYGIIPVAIDNSAHKLNVNVSSPDSSAPEDKVKVDIEVKDAQGMPQETEVSLALVDEGVLRLTNFKTPDPFEFFYGKRGNNIITSDIYSLLIPEFGQKKVGADSNPSGDEAPYDPKKRLNPISAQRVKPVALWKSNIITGKDGKATTEFTVPQFSGSLRIMVVAVDSSSFGNSEEDLKVVEPLMIKPNLPRVISTNDEFIVPVSVFNSTGKDSDVAISLETSEGFVFNSDKAFTVNIKNNKEGQVAFKLKAPVAPQKATITIKASGAGHITDSITELAVRPPVPFTTLIGSGSIKAPATQAIKVPGDWLKGTGQTSLIITSLPALQFAGGLKNLVQYPYGCIEQTTSCTFPLLYLKDIAALVDPKKFNPTQIDNYIDAGIRRVLAMQTYSGGFSYWPGYNYTYDNGSVYATDFLIEAEEAGYAVPDFAKNTALDYCEKILAGKEENYPLELKAYSCYVLSKAGRLKPSWIRRLQEVKDKLPEYSRFHLAAALFALGDKRAVQEILGAGMPDSKVERQTGDSLNSYTRANAIALSVYMDIDPENPIVPTLVKRLQGSMKNGSWETTQDNAMALLALGKYASYVKHQDVNYSGTVSADGKVIAQFDNNKDLKLENEILAGTDVKISLQGKGTAYYYWVSEGVPVSERVEEKHNGIEVNRNFFDRNDKPLDMAKIKQGEVIIVDITFNSAGAYKNVVVEDLLPACFEIENPRLATSETMYWIKKDMIEPGHIDMRDDRLLLFTDLEAKKGMHYRYVVRAVTKGKFILPAINASCMYDPSIISISGQGYVEVGD